VPDGDKKLEVEEEEEVHIDASSFQKRKDVIIGEKTVTELRAALEKIVSKPKPVEQEVKPDTQQAVKEENNLVIVEKEEEKELVKWLDMLCEALNVLLVTAPPLDESYVIALSQQVNDRLDRINELEQLLEAGLNVLSGDEIHLSLLEQLDWLDEQRKLWKTLGEVERQPPPHTHAVPTQPTVVASRVNSSSTRQPHHQQSSQQQQLHHHQQAPIQGQALQEQRLIVETTIDTLKATVRTVLHNSPIVDELLSGLMRAILDNKVDAFWKSFRKRLKKKKASKQTTDRVKQLPFLLREQLSELLSICKNHHSPLSVVVRKSLEAEQEWLDSRLAAMNLQ